MRHWSRRDFLQAGAAACALPLRQLATAEPLAPVSGLLEPFPLHAVRLETGIFERQQEINARYLDSLNVDRMLHCFRLTAALPTSAEPLGGWEAPSVELRGHFTGGHMLSACALAWAGAGNAVLRDKGNALVDGLAQCQKKHGNGYLSAFPPELFARLAADKPVWAPFYTWHKIMAGLLDMYLLAGNTDALQVAEGMAQWVSQYFVGIGEDQRQTMLRTEYGGMNEVLVNLAATTGKSRYLETAHLFEQPSFLNPLAARRDALQGLHANTNVPKIIGAARMYEVTGERRYREIAEYFLEEVLTARSYAIGNTSLDEHWKSPAEDLKGTLGWTNAECCVAYNLMKLERLVYGWSGDARWMDAYERSLFNCRLGTQNAAGLKQYFFPLAAGYWRAYNSAEHSFWCCTGTGAEEFAKFADTIYFRRGDAIVVNQYLSSTLTWKEAGLRLTQRTGFPEEQGTTLTLHLEQPSERTIHLRIPGWVAGRAEIRVNGRLLEATADPGSHVAVRRRWQDGDTLTLALPMAVRREVLAGDGSVAAFLHGPTVLAADLGDAAVPEPMRVIDSGATVPAKLPAAMPLPELKGASVEAAAGSADGFRAQTSQGTVAVLPLYKVAAQRYSVYWKV